MRSVGKRPSCRFTFKIIPDPLTKSLLQSLDFSVDRFFMKLFKTSPMSIIAECQKYLMFRLPSAILNERCSNFEVMSRSLRLI